MSLNLVPLDCPSCGSTLQGESHDILFLCAHCGSGAVLSNEGLELVQTTALLPTPGKRAHRWLPAWLLEAQVEVSNRTLADGRPSKGSTTERLFVVPAFRLTVSNLGELCRAFIRLAPVLTEVPKEPIRGGTLDRGDAETFVRHLVVGEEAAKSDMLASVTVDLEITRARLTALPFEESNGGLRCAITGVNLRTY